MFIDNINFPVPHHTDGVLGCQEAAQQSRTTEILVSGDQIRPSFRGGGVNAAAVTRSAIGTPASAVVFQSAGP